nr:MAG TPA: hypothetical protein [Caudoviricetes sp.]
MARTVDFHTSRPSHFGMAFPFALDSGAGRRGFWACSR